MLVAGLSGYLCNNNIFLYVCSKLILLEYKLLTKKRSKKSVANFKVIHQARLHSLSLACFEPGRTEVHSKQK